MGSAATAPRRVGTGGNEISGSLHMPHPMADRSQSQWLYSTHKWKSPQSTSACEPLLHVRTLLPTQSTAACESFSTYSRRHNINMTHASPNREWHITIRYHDCTLPKEAGSLKPKRVSTNSTRGFLAVAPQSSRRVSLTSARP